MTDEVTSAVGLDDPTLSYNLGSVNNYSPEMAFIDLFKSASTWIGHEDGWGGMNYAELKEGGYLDENGWLMEIPEGFDSVGTLWDWNKADAAAEGRSGTYVLEYEGEGTIRLDGVEVLHQEPGKIVFYNETGGSMLLYIEETDPNGTGDYIKDISVVREEHVELHEAGAVFNPDFLDIIDDSRELRFMDWMRTNGSTQSSWEDRPQESDAFWSTSGGAPLEVMVQLANEVGVDPWFTIPHMADDEYVREFAAYVHENLDPDLTVKVEYTNEAWNGALPAYHWLTEQALAEWGVADGIAYYSKRATEVAIIWEEVYGEDADTQLNNVMGTQTVNSWISNKLLGGHVWKEQEPDTFVEPDTVFDSLAVTTYFGGSTVSGTELRNELLAAIEDPDVDATAYLAEKLMDPDYKNSIPQIAAYLDEQAGIAEKYDVDLVAYEGGQHVQHSHALSIDAEDLAVLTEFLSEFIRSPEMAQLYQEMWDVWANVSDGAFMQFGAISTPHVSGSWGVRTSLDDETPRSALLDLLNETEESWFGEGGNSAYQHGVQITGTETDDAILGTTQEDYLAGADGDDILNGGAGDDGLNGGAGVDLAIFAGNAQDYTIVAEGDGYRVEGPDGSDFVINVEEFRFDDVDVSLQDFLDGNLPHDDSDPDNGNDGGGTPDDDEPTNEVTIGTTDDDEFTGTSGGDEYYGNAGNDVIYGQEGADVLYGGRNDDTVDGGADQDLIYGGWGTDSLAGGDDADALRGGKGTDMLSGGEGHDSLHGGSGDDTLSGEGGNDILRGSDGADTLIGGLGDDTYHGGADADIFIVGQGQDQISDLSENDLLDLTAMGLGADANIADYASMNADGDLEISNGTDSVVLLGLDDSDLSWVSMLT